MIIDKYRKISFWILRIVLIVMSILTLFFFLFSIDIFEGVWEDTLFVATALIIAIFVLTTLIFSIASFRQAFLNKEERNSFITTSFIILANIPILAIFAIIILFIILSRGIYQD